MHKNSGNFPRQSPYGRGSDVQSTHSRTADTYHVIQLHSVQMPETENSHVSLESNFHAICYANHKMVKPHHII
jgi:hypothetical protein